MKNYESIPVEFHGQKYSANTEIKKKYRDLEEQGIKPNDGDWVGVAWSYIVSQEGDKIPDEFLIWFGNQLVGMTAERYRLLRESNGTQGKK